MILVKAAVQLYKYCVGLVHPLITQICKAQTQLAVALSQGSQKTTVLSKWRAYSNIGSAGAAAKLSGLRSIGVVRER